MARTDRVPMKSRTLGLDRQIGQINVGYFFGQTICTHFGTVSSLSMFFIIQPLFLQKTKPFIHITNTFLDWDLNLDRKELGIYPSSVRSPWFIASRNTLFPHIVSAETILSFTEPFRKVKTRINDLR